MLFQGAEKRNPRNSQQRSWLFFPEVRDELVDEQEKSGMIRNYSDRGIDYKIHQSERERETERNTQRETEQELLTRIT